MIYLLEGVDTGGKTTLANSDRFEGFEKFHFGVFPSPTAAFQAYESLLDALHARLAAGETPNVVIDRMHISEHVYGSVYRDLRMSTTRHRIIDQLLYEAGATCIWCHPPFEVVLNNWRARREDELLQKELELEFVYNEYEKIRSFTCLNVQKYDYTTILGV
jgi:thymidylate kinase